jgi:hypothetical protein
MMKTYMKVCTYRTFYILYIYVSHIFKNKWFTYFQKNIVCRNGRWLSSARLTWMVVIKWRAHVTFCYASQNLKTSLCWDQVISSDTKIHFYILISKMTEYNTNYISIYFSTYQLKNQCPLCVTSLHPPNHDSAECKLHFKQLKRGHLQICKIFLSGFRLQQKCMQMSYKSMFYYFRCIATSKESSFFKGRNLINSKGIWTSPK